MIEHIKTNQIVLYLSVGYMMHLETTWHVLDVTCHLTASPTPYELGTCNFHIIFTIPHVSSVTCKVSHVTYHVSCVLCRVLHFLRWLVEAVPRLVLDFFLL